MSAPQQFGLFLIAHRASNNEKFESFMTYAKFPHQRDNQGDYPYKHSIKKQFSHSDLENIAATQKQAPPSIDPLAQIQHKYQPLLPANPLRVCR